LFNVIGKISNGYSNLFINFIELFVEWMSPWSKFSCRFLDAYGTHDVIYDWKLDEHNGVEVARMKLSQFDLFEHKISKKEIQLTDRKNSFSFSFFVFILFLFRRNQKKEIILFYNLIFALAEMLVTIYCKAIFQQV